MTEFVQRVAAMSTVKEIPEIGRSIGLSGDDLLTFIREQQAIERQERDKAREVAKEKQEHEKK